MTRFKKHFIFVYLAASIICLSLLANNFILTPSNKLYKFVPAESDIVIEINTINFVKEVSHQWIFEPQHFESQTPELKSENLSLEIKNIGVNPFSKIILFNEEWADESLWFGIVEVENKIAFSEYLEQNFPQAKVTFKKSAALIQISNSTNQQEVSNHVTNILAGKVKSIKANPVINSNFSNNHELNIYIKSLKSDYITDGYLNINFNSTQIDMSGYFHPIGNTLVEPIAYELEKDIGLSLRSSLNLLNTVYLFNDTKLEYLPDYKQIALDYDGVNLLTNNDVIPVTSFPNINMNLDILDEKIWYQYLDASVEDGSLILKGDTIMINSEAKAMIRYKIDQKKFQLFQKPKIFKPAKLADNTYFSLEIHPPQLIEKMVFRQDENNPPKIIASQIIKIVKSVLEDFSYLKEIDEINFDITKNSDNNNYESKGHIIYHNQNSHSTIESYYLFKNFIKTFGALLN